MTAPTTSSTFYADFKDLKALKKSAAENDPQALRKAAQQFESLFTQMMLKSMRAASPGDALSGSDTMKMYQDMSDQQLAVEMSKGKGLGLADMLVQQLTRSGLAGPNAATSSRLAIGASNSPLAAGAPTAAALAIGATPGLARHSANIFLGNDPGVRATSGELIRARPTISSNTSSTGSRADFVKQIWPHAEQAAKKLGVATSTLVAQAALETGWGQSVASARHGGSSHNYFGVKAHSEWGGPTAGSRTVEFENGVAVSKLQRFRAYSSPAESFHDYTALIGGSPRYAAARDTGGNVAAFAGALQKAGYATDPHYSAKLQAVARSLNDVLGGMQSGSFDAAMAGGGVNSIAGTGAGANAGGSAAALKLAEAQPLMAGGEGGVRMGIDTDLGVGVSETFSTRAGAALGARASLAASHANVAGADSNTLTGSDSSTVAGNDAPDRAAQRVHGNRVDGERVDGELLTKRGAQV